MAIACKLGEIASRNRRNGSSAPESIKRVIRTRAIAAGLAGLVPLAGCVSETGGRTGSSAPGGVNAEAYRAHRVADSLAAFEEVCLADRPTVAGALDGAERHGMGLSGPTGARRAGQPEITIVARTGGQAVTDRAAAFDEYECSVTFRGTWADTALPVVTEALRAGGFKIVAPFERADDKTYYGADTTAYVALVQRGGQRSVAYVAQAGSARTSTGDIRYRYYSGTKIGIISGKKP